MRWSRVLLCLLASALLVGCGAIPRDPDGTLERVRATEVVRVGVSTSAVTAREKGLAEGFADDLGIAVEWTEGGETDLVAAMERGELDLIVGGLRSDSPWGQQVALTRPYAETTGPEGRAVQHVLAVPLGENALLMRLERFLDEVDP